MDEQEFPQNIKKNKKNVAAVCSRVALQSEQLVRAVFGGSFYKLRPTHSAFSVLPKAPTPTHVLSNSSNSTTSEQNQKKKSTILNYFWTVLAT